MSPLGETEEAILADYAAAPDRLEAAVRGLSDAELDIAPAPGEWSIREIVHHVVDGDDLWKGCLKVALGSPGSLYVLEWYEGNEPWAASMDYVHRSVMPALPLFRANRAHIVQLMRELPDAWHRHIVLKWRFAPEGRDVTAGEIMQSQAEHALAHIDDILALRQAHGC
jgi:hypothetical protein